MRFLAYASFLTMMTTAACYGGDPTNVDMGSGAQAGRGNPAGAKDSPTPDGNEVNPEPDEKPSADLTPFTAEEVKSLFAKRCTQCHDDRSPVLNLAVANPMNATANREPSDARDARCVASKYRLIIKPGDRNASLLYRKISGTADCGKKMPYRPEDKKLTADEVERVGLFIDALQ